MAKSSMQVKELKQDGLSREMEVTVSANDIDQRVDQKLLQASKTIRLPGFRPGKVPLKLLKQRYGKSVLGEVLEETVNEFSGKAMEEQKLQPAMQPKIEIKEFDEGKDLVFTMAVEILPEFKIADYKGFKLEKPVAEADDASLDETLNNIAAQNKGSEAITTKRASKEGDILVIDFHGRTADDNVAHDGMHAHGHQLELGSGQFIPGFEDQLTGKKAGEKVEVKVSFPEEYGAVELAGRDAIFDVEIHEIREPKEAVIDNELAKSVGMDDLESLKNAIKDQLSQEYDRQSRFKVKRALLDLLDEKHKFDVPNGMLEMEHNNILQQIQMERQQTGEEGELSDKEKAEFKTIAERRVRLGLILSAIGRENNVTVSDQELQRAVITEAQRYRGQEKQVFDFYSKNQQALESLRAPLFEEKVVDFILELADITEKKVSVEDLMKDDDEEVEKPKKKAASKKSDDKAEEKSEAKKKPAEKKKPAAKKKA